jgi:hypothetical protein
LDPSSICQVRTDQERSAAEPLVANANTTSNLVIQIRQGLAPIDLKND